MAAVQSPRATHLLWRAAERAALAPSIHNTQPWRFALTGDALEIRADRSRRLRVLDPMGRQLLLSCGCAVFNARVSLAAGGYDAAVHRFPDPLNGDVVARLTLPPRATDRSPLRELDWAVEQRRTNRRAFDEEPVPPAVVDMLVAAAAAEGAELFPIVRPDHRFTTALLSQDADRLENADPAYRGELRAWTTDDPRRPDGVPMVAVPYLGAGPEEELPIREFDLRGIGWLPTRIHSTMNQCLLLLGTAANDRTAWLRAGEALERVLLEATRHGYTASPFTQLVEVALTNRRLREELGLTMHPHVLLRVGRAPATPRVPRRPLVDMLLDED